MPPWFLQSLPSPFSPLYAQISTNFKTLLYLIYTFLKPQILRNSQPFKLILLSRLFFLILLTLDFDVNRFNPESDLESKLARISKFDQSFRKKGLVTQHLRLVRAKTHLQNNQDKEALEILNQMQNELEKVRELPKAILSLLNEVWAAYQWNRGQFERCHQSLLSFLVYCELDALDWREKEQVVYRLMWCTLLFTNTRHYGFILNATWELLESPLL